MINESMPRKRLITQNILSSASLFEREENPSWSSIYDLSTFIDLYCLYDRVIVFGRGAENVQFGWRKSPFFRILKRSRFVDFEAPYKIGRKETSIATSKHLLAFLGDTESAKFNSLIEYAMKPETAFSLQEKPDVSSDIETGKLWLLTSPNHKNLVKQLHKEQEAIRGTTFLLRTFLYLAYSDVANIAFTPDTARTPVLSAILDKEEQFRGKLLSKMQTAWKESMPGNKELFHRVSPFGALVFERAYPDKRKIVPTMEKLRSELTPMRKRLRDIEDRLLWRSQSEAIIAQQEWNNIIKEIETNFGPEPQLVNIRRGINFGEKITGNIESPEKLKGWFETLSDLPFHIAMRLINRGPVIELHRFKQELTGSSRLNHAIMRLFEPT